MATHFLYHNHLVLNLANVENYLAFHGALGLVTQVVHFFLTCLFLL